MSESVGGHVLERVDDRTGRPRANLGVPPIDHDLSVAIYRAAHSLPGGAFPQVQGLLDADVRAALVDPRTLTASMRSAGGVETDVPVLTPIELAPWYSPEYRTARFRRDLAAGASVWHLSTFPSLSEEEFDRVTHGALLELTSTSPDGAIVFADHADRTDDPSNERLTTAFRSTGHFEEVLIRSTGAAREHYFAGVLHANGTTPEHGVIDLRTRVDGPIDDEEFLTRLWSIYEAPFRKLAEKTPLRTYFERDELAKVIRRPGVLQAQHRVNDNLVSWMMMTNDVASFPWMDADAFRACAQGLDDEHIWIFPGVVTDEGYRGQNCIDHLIDAMTLALLRHGPRHLVVFETLDENVEFLPGLIADSVSSTGYGAITFKEVGSQVHRVWRTIR